MVDVAPAKVNRLSAEIFSTEIVRERERERADERARAIYDRDIEGTECTAVMLNPVAPFLMCPSLSFLK